MTVLCSYTLVRLTVLWLYCVVIHWCGWLYCVIIHWYDWLYCYWPYCVIMHWCSWLYCVIIAGGQCWIQWPGREGLVLVSCSRWRRQYSVCDFFFSSVRLTYIAGQGRWCRTLCWSVVVTEKPIVCNRLTATVPLTSGDSPFALPEGKTLCRSPAVAESQ